LNPPPPPAPTSLLPPPPPCSADAAAAVAGGGSCRARRDSSDTSRKAPSVRYELKRFESRRTLSVASIWSREVHTHTHTHTHITLISHTHITHAYYTPLNSVRALVATRVTYPVVFQRLFSLEAVWFSSMTCFSANKCYNNDVCVRRKEVEKEKRHRRGREGGSEEARKGERDRDRDKTEIDALLTSNGGRRHSALQARHATHASSAAITS